jgi:hypothetical protein
MLLCYRSASTPFEPRAQVWTVPLETDVFAKAYVWNTIRGTPSNLIPDPAFGQVPTPGQLARVDYLAGVGWG